MDENGGHSHREMPREVFEQLKALVPAYLNELREFEKKKEAENEKLMNLNELFIPGGRTGIKESEQPQISFKKYPQKMEQHRYAYQLSPICSEMEVDSVEAIASHNSLPSVPISPISRSPPMSKLNAPHEMIPESKSPIYEATPKKTKPKAAPISVLQEETTPILATSIFMSETDSFEDTETLSMPLPQIISGSVSVEILNVAPTPGPIPISITTSVPAPTTINPLLPATIPGSFSVSTAASLPVSTAFSIPASTNTSISVTPILSTNTSTPESNNISVLELTNISVPELINISVPELNCISAQESNNISAPALTNSSAPEIWNSPVAFSTDSSIQVSSTASYLITKPTTTAVPSFKSVFSPALFVRDDTVYDFNCIPDRVAKKLFYYFDYRSLKLCRLVCASWNRHIQCHRKFLESSVFHMNTNIEVIKLFESSPVEWMFIRFQGVTSENKTRVNYQQKFLQSKFQPYTILTDSLISLTLYKSEMGKDSFLRWLTACKWLRILEITSCSFTSAVGRTGWKQDPSVLALEHLRILSIEDMSLPQLVDTMKLLYSQIKCLEELKICERKRESGQTKNIVTTMETELISLIKRLLQKSRPRIYSLFVSLQKFENEIIFYDFFKKLPHFEIPFLDFGFEVLTYKGTNGCSLNIGTEFNPSVTLKGIFKRSVNLKSLHIPGLAVNFSGVGDISAFFPQSLEELSAQITLPDSNPESNLIFGLQKPECSLRKIAIHESHLTDYQWMNLKKYFPLLTNLTVLCSSFGDHSLMTISSCLLNLKVLKLEKVKHITDFGLTGIGEEYLKSLKESWPDIPDSGFKSSEGISDFPLIGRPISSITNLRVFHCIGSTDITDVGIAHGLFLSNLKNLSITGSSVKISDTGLDVLSSNSPLLSSVNLSLSSKFATAEGIHQFVSKLPYFDAFKSVVELKPTS